ncbi:hypothetical protein SS1G_01113 [Paecilomyces variotii No. 5]|uniref:Amidohydrolase-related domain-containing protein n=1 Tax=Byssochlamys spectabilis (strain No. 5 / NBRC 109023) TaxID=1356009 RepID=V5G341_BYSSN|nr:hypothetical protein SS1G_01113 [Paecilomyces variotii No. 5]
MASSQAATDDIAIAISKEISSTPYACSSLSRLTGGTGNFVYRGTLIHPLPDGTRTVVIKHAEDYVASQPDFKLPTTRCRAEEYMLNALNDFPKQHEGSFFVKSPRLFHFNQQTNTHIMEDLSGAVDLKTFLRSPAVSTLSQSSATAFGRAIGRWLAAFHTWGSAAEKSDLVAEIEKNQLMKEIKFQVNYEILMRTIDDFPDILSGSREVFEKVREFAKEELEKKKDEDGTGLIHGDFWTGNILLPNDSNPSDSPVAVFITDWELSQVCIRALDLGQMIAELYELKHFKDIDAGVWILQGFVAGYHPPLSDEVAFRTAIHVGVHLVCWGSRVPGWGSQDQVRDVVKIGRDFIVKGWEKDRKWRTKSILECFYSVWMEKWTTIIVLICAIAALLLPVRISRHCSIPTASISDIDLQDGLRQCALNQIRPYIDTDLASRRLKTQRTGPRTILRNATLINGDGEITKDTTIVIQGVIFINIKSGTAVLDYTEKDSNINLEGRFVTPGLIDMHSHAGVREEPQLWATEDVTEISAPVTPWGRAVDALKPHDQAIRTINSGGITTSLVLTGAKNLISGEGAVIKMKRTDSIRELLINMTENNPNGKPLRYLKMAMGENQKRQFEHVSGGPATRLGESYWFRFAYDQARQLIRKQDRWCEKGRSARGHPTLTEEYPTSLQWQTLVDVLRGDVRVNVHGYETEDVFAMFDHADEFGFNITAMHHALHSDLIAREIKDREITIAGFSDSWGDKKELYNVSSYMLRTIAEEGIPVALTRDHPAEHGQWLAYEAQIARHFGLNASLAISSITSVPARALGLDNRIGHILPGYDADLVVWDRHPLRVGATPLEVYIDGKVSVRAYESLWKRSLEPSYRNVPTHSRLPGKKILEGCHHGQADFVIRGITKSFVNGSAHLENNYSIKNITAVIRNGQIICVGGIECDIFIKQAERDNVPVITVEDGYMLPGLTVVTRQHGLTEMRQEPSTTDGFSTGNIWNRPLFSKHGIKFDGIHLQRAHRSGVTRIITPPLTKGSLHGISTLFRSGAHSVLDRGAIQQGEVALHFTIGHEAKQPESPSITSQISLLRDLLTPSPDLHPLYQRAAKGRFPVIVHTNNKDVIAHMVALKSETGANIIIMGGGEAHLISEHIAKASMPVILAPWGCEPLFWENRNCFPGPPLTERLGAQTLLDAGVKIGVSNWDDTNNHIRNSIWEASWIAGPDNQTLALDLVSRNIEEILGLPRSSDFVIYEGSPFEFGSKVALIVEEGIVQLCAPDVDG